MINLEKIIESKKREVRILKNKYSVASFEDMEYYKCNRLSFIDKLSRNNNLSLICEIKKVSPSKGIIRSDFNHLEISNVYFNNNVDAVSILTDKKYFQGDINYLADIANIKNTPLLRKDFIIDEIQVHESKAKGADLILLICEVVSKTQITEFTMLANEVGLEVLLEIHSEKQLYKIDFDKNKLIGINNRNLNDFSVSLETTRRLKKVIPEGVFVVSESGISNMKDVLFLKKAGVNALLVGESIMVEKNVDAKVKELKKWCSSES